MKVMWTYCFHCWVDTCWYKKCLWCHIDKSLSRWLVVNGMLVSCAFGATIWVQCHWVIWQLMHLSFVSICAHLKNTLLIGEFSHADFKYMLSFVSVHVQCWTSAVTTDWSGNTYIYKSWCKFFIVTRAQKWSCSGSLRALLSVCDRKSLKVEKKLKVLVKNVFDRLVQQDIVTSAMRHCKVKAVSWNMKSLKRVQSGLIRQGQ